MLFVNRIIPINKNIMDYCKYSTNEFIQKIITKNKENPYLKYTNQYLTVSKNVTFKENLQIIPYIYILSFPLIIFFKLLNNIKNNKQ
jgi:hypothetical protein